MIKLITPLLAILMIATGCKSNSNNKQPEPVALNYSEVVCSKISNEMSFVGQSSANFLYTIQPRVSGYLKGRHFDSGEKVDKGRLLFTIDDSQYAIALQQAKADLAASIAVEKRAKLDYDRNVPLAKIRAVSQSTLDQITAEWTSAQESVKAKEQALKQARLNLSYTKIYAPETGIASNSIPAVGDYVGVGTEFTILNYVSQINKIEVVISIPMKRYLEITNDNNFSRPNIINKTLLGDIRMELSDGTLYEHSGAYDYTKSTINSTTNSIELATTFDNSQGRLRPGQFVRIHCSVGEPREATLLPQKALFRTQNINLVYVVNGGKVEIREVKLGDTYRDFWIVESGVECGDKVLTNGFYKVKNGMEVELKSNK